MTFPNDFVWGAATSSFQIEGAASQDGRGPSIWDAFCATPGKVAFGDTGDTACDHYNRMEDDVAIMRDIGLRAYRFSVAWPRVMPTGAGDVNEAGLDFYDRLVDRLLDAGIEPCATLYHWDLPLALHNKGGWLSRDIVPAFERYARVVAERLSDRVSTWMTINEPQICVELGYGTGEHAPGLKLSVQERLRAAHHMILAHGAATRAIRDVAPAPQRIGWATVSVGRYPVEEHPDAIEQARTLSLRTDAVEFMGMPLYADPIAGRGYPRAVEEAFCTHDNPVKPGDLDIIAEPIDFVGLNIYSGGAVDRNGHVPFPPGVARTTMGWAVAPDVMRWQPRFVTERYNTPIMITENGMANTDWIAADGRVHDAQRIDFLDSYLSALAHGITEGADVRAYFQWSLLDNFEWAYGYDRRFGLVHVDFDTLVRTPKDSARWYSEVIATNGGSLAHTKPAVHTRAAPVRSGA